MPVTCPNTNSPQWKALVNKIGVFEAMREYIKNGEIPDAESYEETFKGTNATLKIVNALTKTPRTTYPSNNIQGFYNDLIKQGAPKNQIDLLKDHIARNNIKEINTNELIVSLLSEIGYTVEINTAKSELYKSGYFASESVYGEWAVYDAQGNNVESDLTQGEAVRKAKQYNEDDSINSQYYSNLTVPGGTNYTENEIRTPDITPSIKGHGAFSTDSGIGWFRLDEKVESFESLLSSGQIKQVNC